MRTLITPSKYVQGSNALKILADYLEPYGHEILLIALPEDAERVEYALELVEGKGIHLHKVAFTGECSLSEIERIVEQHKGEKYGALIGLGGGKAIDTAKSVSLRLDVPLFVIPTIAATDAPCSGMSILYDDDDHVMIGKELLKKNPEVVLVDTTVIANAPAHFLISGFGDALATYYEARAVRRSNSDNYAKGKFTASAWALATLCRDILFADSAKALEACRKHVVTEALENVIEANLYMSCIGFESVGCAAAHALYNNMTIWPETERHSHGEKVAIGLLVQLILENEPDEEMRKILKYYKTVGLPTNLAAIGLEAPTEEHFRRVAKKVLSTKNAIHNLPIELTEDKIVDAFKLVDSLEEMYCD